MKRLSRFSFVDVATVVGLVLVCLLLVWCKIIIAVVMRSTMGCFGSSSVT